jgi:hypothetical protein
MKRWWLVSVVVVALIVGGVAVAVASGSRVAAPARSALNYPWGMLVEEAETMNDCVECHDAEDFHTCASCHDDHGSVEMAGVPFNALVHLAGDVPEGGFIPVNEIVPYRDQPGSHVSLLDFLADQGVEGFETVTLASRDGGFVTINRANLTDEALLMPHVDGIRFAAENLHVSTWLKGISRIIVVGLERPLTLDGYHTSFGRLVLGPTRALTIDQTDVMLKSATDGEIRKAKTAARVEGVPLEAIVDDPDFEQLTVRDAAGQTYTFTAKEAQGALLAQLRGRPEVVLVLPGQGRAQWVSDVVEVSSTGE